MFFWYQKPNDKHWHIALSSDRLTVLQHVKPSFITVLDASEEPQDNWTREDRLRMKYSGPLYFDWDAEDFQGSIGDFKQHINTLKNLGLNLDCTRMYVTGGRGFHMEIPQGCFMDKPPAAGVAALPWIYKEIALKYQTDSLDLRIYSAKRGRMWRACNVQRDNGNFKVQITTAEALDMNSEMYKALCSQPRPEFAPSPPEPCISLKPVFLDAKNKVDKLLKLKIDVKKSVAELKVFKGDYPPALKTVLQGTDYNAERGFNQIALQLAITAVALGKTEDAFIVDCDGLIQNHQGDGHQYNTPTRRLSALRNMYWYVHGDDCYVYSTAGVRSICAYGVSQQDISGNSDDCAWDDATESPNPEEENSDLNLTDEEKALDFTKYGGIRTGRMGVTKETEKGPMILSPTVFARPVVLKDIETLRDVGFLVDVSSVGGKPQTQSIGLDTLSSRAKLDMFCAGFGSNFTGTDAQASTVRMILASRAERAGKVSYVIHKEGLDVIQDPTKIDPLAEVHERAYINVWVSDNQVHLDKSCVIEGQRAPFTYQPQISKIALAKSDIHKASPLEYSEENQALIQDVLESNEPYVVACFLGWFVSCYHRMHYHIASGQFPLLQVVGTAGSGKSKTTDLFCKLHHVATKPLNLAVALSTPHAMKVAMITSASTPLIVEEAKASEMVAYKYHNLLQSMRLAYNCATSAAGGGSDGSSEASYKNIQEFTMSTPICYVSEMEESQTAIQQRSVKVHLSPKGHNEKYENTSYFAPKVLNSLGRAIMENSLRETVESRRAALLKCKAEVKAEFGAGTHDRLVTNVAVVLAGLDFFQEIVSKTFDNVFDSKILELKSAILSNKENVTRPIMSEISKMLNDMAYISRREKGNERHDILEGLDYAYSNGGKTIDLSARNLYIRYRTWCKDKGAQPLMGSPEAFIGHLGRHSAMVEKGDVISTLRTHPSATKNQHIVRMDVQLLADEGVEEFQSDWDNPS